jgi:hypothetical protein
MTSLKNSPRTHTLAYLVALDEVKKSMLTPGVNIIKLFSFVTYDEAQ